MNQEKHHITKVAEDELELTQSLIFQLKKLNKNFSYWRSFWHGVIIALGSTVGVAIALLLISYILRALGFIPGLDNVIDKILPIVNQGRNQ